MKDLEGVNQPVVEIDVSTEEPHSETEEEQAVTEDRTNSHQPDEESSTVLFVQNELDNVQTIMEHGSTQLKNKERNL